MIAFVNGRQKEMLPTLHHEQLVRAAFGTVEGELGNYVITWSLRARDGGPAQGIGGFVTPDAPFDLEGTAKKLGAEIEFDVKMPRIRVDG